MTITIALPAQAIDYEWCSKLLVQENKASTDLAKSLVDEEINLKVPSSVCKGLETEKETDECESNWKKAHLASTQKPRGNLLDIGPKFYSFKSKYMNERLLDILRMKRNAKCP